jgi:hypothetical protein
MDTMSFENLNKIVNNIKVRNLDNEDVEVVNDSPLNMIGKGRQGAVFQLSEDICVKVFGNTKDCERELYALSLGQETNLFPKIHAHGPLYIAMDLINGVDLREYLQSQPLTSELSSKLIEMLITFKEIGFERIDHHKRQIYMQPDGNLKVIDVGRTVWRDRVYPYPRKLLKSLGKKNKELFLSHVQAMAPKLYKEWQYYIHMENLSRQIYQAQMKNPTTSPMLKNSIKNLLTNTERENFEKLLALVQKVFKEEWMKTMLALGYHPVHVMQKIDEYWYRKERFFNERYPNHKEQYDNNNRRKHGKHNSYENHQAPNRYKYYKKFNRQHDDY